MTDSQLLQTGYAILEGDVDDDMTKDEWRRFQELRDEAEEEEFLRGEDEFYEDYEALNTESPDSY